MDTDWIGTHRKRYANRKFDEYFFRKPCDQTVFKDILRIHSLRNPTSFSYIPRPQTNSTWPGGTLCNFKRTIRSKYAVPDEPTNFFVQAPGFNETMWFLCQQFFQMWPPSGARLKKRKHCVQQPDAANWSAIDWEGNNLRSWGLTIYIYIHIETYIYICMHDMEFICMTWNLPQSLRTQLVQSKWHQWHRKIIQNKSFKVPATVERVDQQN